MKRFFSILLFSLVFSLTAIAQQQHKNDSTKDSKLMHNIFAYRDLFEWFEYYDEYNGYIYDSLDIIRYNFNDTNNIWHVCQPNKGDWTYGNWQPYPDTFPAKVLITDSINPYPTNNLSTIEFYIIKPAWTYTFNFCWSRLVFQFCLKCETDTLNDGLFIEISFDGGNTFANIQDTASVLLLNNGPCIIYPTYFIVNRSILNNSYGFSGNMTIGNPPTSQGWYYPSFQFEWDNTHAHDVDTAIIRLYFITDSINTLKRGIIIDNIDISVQDVCYVSAENNFLKYTVNLFPNPISEYSILSFSNPECERFKLEIVDVKGRIVFEGETNEQQFSIGNLNLQRGIYYYRLSNQYGDVKIDKFVKN